MTLLEAKEYDFAGARRRRNITIAIIVILIILAALTWHFRFWPEDRVADRFFNALEHQDYKQAYGIWFHDPHWEQHPDRYKEYDFQNFYTDWGPGGTWGLIKNYKIYTTVPGGTGVTVVVIVNGRSEPANVWVQKDNKTMSFPPRDYEIQ